MKHESTGDTTQLLQGWRDGDRKALDSRVPIVHRELQRLAHHQLRSEPPDHTLQRAALVNEAYLRLAGMNSPQWESRAHFFRDRRPIDAQILVDYARRHRAMKRGGGNGTLSLDDTGLVEPGRAPKMDVVAVDDALKTLTHVDARKVKVVELHFFGSLSFEEIAAVLKVSVNTISRDWSTARAGLHREMSQGRSGGH